MYVPFFRENLNAPTDGMADCAHGPRQRGYVSTLRTDIYENLWDNLLDILEEFTKSFITCSDTLLIWKLGSSLAFGEAYCI